MCIQHYAYVDSFFHKDLEFISASGNTGRVLLDLASKLCYLTQLLPSTYIVVAVVVANVTANVAAANVRR